MSLTRRAALTALSAATVAMAVAAGNSIHRAPTAVAEAAPEKEEPMTNTTDKAALAADTLEGLWNRRDPRVVDERIAPDYIQHNPLIPNGAAPVRGFVESLAGVQQPIIEVKRALTEGNFAAVHSRYAWTPTFELDGGRGSAVVDLFLFGPDGTIIEHWDVAQAVPETTANGNTMFDGGGDPNAQASPEQLATNTGVVARLFDAFRAGDTGAFADVIAEDYIQHNPQVPNGLAAVQGFFGQVGPVDVDVYRTIAQGDVVLVHAHYKTFNMAGVDIFRLADGRIVEHWDVLQEIPATTASGNDMFRQVSP
jgi:predicted SnoaL-like aldol condensation-catalyzing enzyme